MNIQEHISLKSYTTFMIESTARYFITIDSMDGILELLNHPAWKCDPFILGKGSNVLFTKDYDGLIIIDNTKGREVISETDKYIDVRFASGELWHESVMWSVKKGLWGLENLSLIPGTIGSSAVQNIGAYGAEASETILFVEAINLINGQKEILDNHDCEFGYRQSIFKKFPKKYFITSVTYRLSKIPQPKLSYGVITKKLESKKVSNPNVAQISEIVIEIRKSKLPDVGSIGMAGSFFKNPIILKKEYQNILEKYPTAPAYDLGNGYVKIPAGWIIETLGYKGAREGDVGTYHKHALVIVNYAQATGIEVWAFAQKIMSESQQLFNIALEPEVIIR